MLLAWSVGLNKGERQESEWFGPDCSLRHCPSADNPRTRIDETDCSQRVNVDNQTFTTLNYNRALGSNGNICQVDCANQGSYFTYIAKISNYILIYICFIFYVNNYTNIIFIITPSIVIDIEMNHIYISTSLFIKLLYFSK